MPTLLHLGLGNFHRAHQAIYTVKANALTGSNWRIRGVSLRRPAMRDALRPQEYDYTLVERAGGRSTYRRISVIDDILVEPEDPAAVRSAIADRDTPVITLTITEKGYLPGSAPSSMSVLAEGLALRADHGTPVTLISCDNLTGNGRALETALRAEARALGLDIGGYLDEAVACPDTMVDRIVPATTDALREEVLRETGWADASPVAAEGFSEWVLEDRFASDIPDWAAVGAVIVPSVTPYELRKLRLLNGSHSALAYAGLLKGHSHVHEAIADPDLRQKISGLMSEAIATLPPEMAAHAPAYCEALLERFSNPALAHRLDQIAQDGSQKLPIRLIATLRERQVIGLASPHVEWALSAWCAYVARCHADGQKLHDPMAADLMSVLDEGGSAQDLLDLIG